MDRRDRRLERIGFRIGLLGGAFVIAAAATGSKALVATGLALVLVGNVLAMFALLRRRGR